MILIKNVAFGCEENECGGYVCIENEKITEVGYGECEKSADIVLDGLSGVLYPGLCDIHTHGAKKIDFTQCSTDDAVKLENWYSSCGVTSVFPTTTTETEENILTAVKNIAAASKLVTKVHYDGIHIEGPFLSHEKRGAHNEALLKLPDIGLVKKIIECANGLKIRMTLAPELPGALDFIKECKKLGVMITLGHSAADTDISLKAINLGADCVTHTFNAMNQLHHRNPGLLGAALAEDVFAEIICDGLHVHPTAVKLFSKAKGQDKAVLITDSIILAGCDERDGVLKSAGEDVCVKDGKIVTVDSGVLAGSSLKLCDGVLNYAHFCGVTLDEAVKCASANSAKAVGIYDVCGSIEQGKRADFALFSRDGKLLHTVCGGKIVL